MIVRIASVQYHLRAIENFEQFEKQVNFVLNAAAGYQPQFVLLPELFTTQLISFLEPDNATKSVRLLDQFTDKYINLLKKHSQKHGYYLIGGTHPNLRGEDLYNSAFFFTPEGEVHLQDKIHRTKWEKSPWNTTAGDEVKVFNTKYGKVAIMICYDIEFPELTRAVAELGTEIIFVPSCTDDRQGFLRVRYCCHARAIENQVYVAMASTVGNLPVPSMSLHYGQSSIITPSDFPFARDGIAAEGAINQEQIVVADVNLQLLDENRIKGTTIPLLDKRKEIYQKDIIEIKA